MKAISRSCLPALICFLIFTVCDARAESYAFKIIEGQVETTTPFCATRPDCPVVSASLMGRFSADIQADKIAFSNARVTATPQTGFELPDDPATDSNGTTRSIVFSFDGEVLEVSGVEDNSAFDGPVYEYQFIAETTEPAGFDAMGFYKARLDFRKCMWPMCGGVFLSAVNKVFTRCADGSRARECYVPDMDWKALGFDPLAQDAGVTADTTYLFQGSIEPREYDDFGNLGVFVGKGAYIPASKDAPQGLFAGVRLNDIRCITWPCPSADVYFLNHNSSRPLAGFDLDEAAASAEDKQYAQDLLNDGETLIVAGMPEWIKGPAGYGLAITANQFYLPIESAQRCEDGYEFKDGRCLTPYGCEAPLIELKTFGGVPDPETGEAIIRYDCVKRCIPPQMEYVGPARCEVYMP